MAAPRNPTLTLVIAAAGYGKTTALRRRFAGTGQPVAWHHAVDPAALAAGGVAELARLAGGASALVLEDLPAMPDQVGQAVLEAVARLPGSTSVAISSRHPIGSASAGWSGRLALSQLRPADLALGTDQIAELLDTEYGLSTPDLAERVAEVTAGWPALVRLVAETLRGDGVRPGPLLAAVTEPGDPVASYLAAHVLAGLPAAVRLLLCDLADLAPVTAGLATALGHRRAASELGALARTGLLTHAATDPDTGPRVIPAVAAVAGHAAPPVPRSTLEKAAAWYHRHGPPRAAARTALLAGDPQRCAQILGEHGDALVATGRPVAVAELVDALPARLRDRRLRLLAGDALRTAGDVAAAAQAYEQVAAAEPEWDAALAWRMGLIHYLRGDQPAALACFARGAAPAAGTPADRAMLSAWTAAATARHGDTAAGVEHARHAYRLAGEAGHDGALATAHVSLGLCLGLAGDQLGSEEHYQLARQAAERAGDLVLLARTLTNQSYHLAEQARYAEAREVAGQAVRYAEAAGHANLAALATGNEASALLMLGEYDEAAARYTRVLHRYRRMGSRRCAAALIGLGEVHRLRGWREQARAAFEEAVELADAGGSRELAVRAMAGLARVLLPDDPAGAGRYAKEAVDRTTGGIRLPALLASGWVSVVDQDWQAVRTVAGEAVDLARAGGHRAGLAEALELRAAAEADPGRAREPLREAHAIWTDAGAVDHAARALVGLSRLPGASADDRFAALLAGQRLAAAGLPLEQAGTATAPGARPAGTDVELRTLGRLEVRVGGQPVPPAAWQSRRARDVLRILVTRRGRPVPRGELCELLWPDDDPARTGHRLSVLLSIVRGVLDPDKQFPPDRYLVSDPACVALDITALRVDVVEFLAAVGHGRRLLDRDEPGAASTVLAAAVGDYRADVFEDEPYDDWSAGLREQARAAYLAALRMLARSQLATGATGPAVDCLLRLLEKDPYDEPAHRELVAALVAGGQHGEARRAFDRYREAMRAIGVRLPDPALLSPREGASVVVVGLDPLTGDRPVPGRIGGRQPSRPAGRLAPGLYPDRPHPSRLQVRGGQQRVDEHVRDRPLDRRADAGHRAAGAGNRHDLR